MTKDQRAIVVEYVATLSEDDIRTLYQRLSDKFSGDVPDALNVMSCDPRMDSVLGAAESSHDFFEILDKIREILGKEVKKKPSNLK